MKHTTTLEDLLRMTFLKAPLHLQFWMLTVLVMNVGIVFVLEASVETKVISGASNLGVLVLMVRLCKGGCDFAKLLSSGHIYWSFLLLWLCKRIIQQKKIMDPRLRQWLIALIVADVMSVVLEVLVARKTNRGAPSARTSPANESSSNSSNSPSDAENASSELLQVHLKFNHMSFGKLQTMARKGKIPKRLAACKVPVCSACQCGKATKAGKRRGSRCQPAARVELT